MRQKPSPNHNPRSPNATIQLIIIHTTDMTSATAALERLTNPQSAVSAHYLIDTDATTYQLVPEDQRAWHAGVSQWRNITDVNSHSIGIELQNTAPSHPQLFSQAQLDALQTLIAEIKTRHPIEAVLGHDEVAPGRKQDPGPLFPWERFR